jgi:hypothetical protein
MPATASIHPALAAVANIDWSDTGAILAGAEPLFVALTTDGLLDELLARLPGTPGLPGLCERQEFVDKLVLADFPECGVRIRAHVYPDRYFDRPHNHRWPFATYILRGAYRHRIYGTDDNFGEHTDPRTMLPIVERVERAGSSYALLHNGVHAVQAESDTISLLVRGPAQRDVALIQDADGGFFWVRGSAQETPAQLERKRMTPTILAETITRVRALADLT